jgi:hypothetical protein
MRQIPSLAAATLVLAFAISGAGSQPADQRPDEAHLTADKSRITLGDSVTLSWSAPANTRSIYLSSLEPGSSQPATTRKGTVTVSPSESTDFVLLAATPDAVIVRTSHVSVAGVRGTVVQLAPDDLSCKVSLSMSDVEPLSLLARVKDTLEARSLAVDQEFMRGSDFVLQTRPAPQQLSASGAIGARQVIHQVALGLNLAGAGKGAAGIVAVQVGSQLRFRRLQQAQWQIDSDATRCLEETRGLEQPLREILKH